MLAFLALVQIATFGPDTAPPRPISQLVHTRWTVKDGAPNETITLAQTTDGYLWLGTRSGLVRFDGVRFVPFAPLAGDTIPGGGIRSLLGARDGSLWVVWGSGAVTRARNGRVTSYGPQDGLPFTHRLAESSSGELVAGTAKGLSRFAAGQWKDANQDWQYPGTESRAVWFDREGALWAETQDRVVYLPNGATRFVDPGMMLKGTADNGDFAEARDGTIWMAELARSAHTIPRAGDQRAMAEVKVGTWTLLIDRLGSLWIGSAGDGLRRVRDPTRFYGRTIAQFGAEAEQFTRKDGLLSDLITALLEDREGNIWVASLQGLERFSRGAFTPISTPGPARPRVIYATRDTTLWVSTYSATGLLGIGPREARTIETNFFVYDLHEDAGGRLWTVHGSTVMKVTDHRFSPLPVVSGQARGLVDVTSDPDGQIWVFDESLGLLRLIGDSLVPTASIHDPIWAHGTLFSDRSGRIWVAQHTQVALYDHGQVRLFNRQNSGLPGRVLRFYQDRAGNIWATGDGGLSRFEQGTFRSPPGLNVSGRSVYGVLEDDEGAWWILTRRGVLRLPPGEIDRALADSSYQCRQQSFDELDGLPGLVNATMYGPLLARTPDGRIWVATDSGVAFVDPRNLPTPAPPKVLIETVRVNGTDRAPAAALEVPPGVRDLEIDYTATSLSVPERVQFRYRLEGSDPTWHEAGGRRRAYYTGLAPGPYRFRVLAASGDGQWNGAADWSFRVLPAWYQTIWFKTGMVLLIGGLVAASTALLQRRRHLVSQQTLRSSYEATLAERARIAQELHDTLLQGMAGVSMQLKAAERALPDQPDVAAETLVQVQQLTRDTLREARQRVLDLHEPDLGDEDVAGALENSGRGLIGNTGIGFSLATKGDRRRLPRAVEIASIRIGREAIANAVKHAEARRIEVVVWFEPTLLRLEVRDDGRGFTPEQGEGARRDGHLGLTGMRDRAVRAGGRCEVRSGPRGGTEMIAELPVKKTGEG